MTHLLDTTALLAHFLDEKGADEVDIFLSRGPDQIALASPSWVELDTRLRELIDDPQYRQQVFDLYTKTLTTLLPLDRAATESAIHLRQATPGRLPLSDALIAGTAFSCNLTLVHRDAHFDAVPDMSMVRLPVK